jgi:hypothetical protein
MQSKWDNHFYAWGMLWIIVFGLSAVYLASITVSYLSRKRRDIILNIHTCPRKVSYFVQL